MYVPPRRKNCSLSLLLRSLTPATATHATETFKSFWRQKERCRHLREPKLDRRGSRQPHTRPRPAIYSKRTLLASPSLLPSPPPMFVLQSLNHRAGRVRECVSGRGRVREGRRLPTDRVQRRPLHFHWIDSNDPFVEMAQVTQGGAQLTSKPCTFLTRRGQTLPPSLPPSPPAWLPSRLRCSMITCLIAALCGAVAVVPRWPLIAQIKKQPAPWRTCPAIVTRVA